MADEPPYASTFSISVVKFGFSKIAKRLNEPPPKSSTETELKKTKSNDKSIKSSNPVLGITWDEIRQAYPYKNNFQLTVPCSKTIRTYANLLTLDRSDFKRPSHVGCFKRSLVDIFDSIEVDARTTIVVGFFLTLVPGVSFLLGLMLFGSAITPLLVLGLLLIGMFFDIILRQGARKKERRKNASRIISNLESNLAGHVVDCTSEFNDSIDRLRVAKQLADAGHVIDLDNAENIRLAYQDLRELLLRHLRTAYILDSNPSMDISQLGLTANDIPQTDADLSVFRKQFDAALKILEERLQKELAYPKKS